LGEGELEICSYRKRNLFTASQFRAPLGLHRSSRGYSALGAMQAKQLESIFFAIQLFISVANG
jgi:hypothetical protein